MPGGVEGSWLPVSLAGAGGGGVPMAPRSALPGLPSGPGGAPGPGNGSGSAGGTGGSSGNGMQAGIGAGLAALITLVLLRLARRAAVKPVWRAYLPEVPPA